MAGRMSKELCITKACPTFLRFLRSSGLSWLAGIMMRALWHRENWRTRYQERALDLQSLHTDWKDTSHDSGGIAYLYQLEGHELQCDPRRRRPAYEDGTFQAGADTDWCTPASRLDCQRLRLSLHLQVLVPPVPLLSSTAVAAYASSTKKTSFSIPDSSRNLMTACRKNLPHGLSKSLSAGPLELCAWIWLSQCPVTDSIVPLVRLIEGAKLKRYAPDDNIICYICVTAGAGPPGKGGCTRTL